MGTGLLSLFIAAQLFLGDTMAVKMFPLQPSKFQAMEGYWDPTPTAPSASNRV
jgi:cytochrome d ubiquinol oxidase subunit I